MASRESSIDAITLLKRDHEAVQNLFSEFKKFEDEEIHGVDEVKQAIIDDVCAMLRVHMQIEEEIFYPAAREVLKGEEELMEEAQADHDSAKQLIARIEDGGVTDPVTIHLFLDLSHAIDLHVEEEHEEMFPKVLKAGMDTVEIGKRLAARKDEIVNSPGGPRPGTTPQQQIVDRITDYLGPSI
jgi:hypothetical protein